MVCFQSSADGEFSRVKDKYFIHLNLHLQDHSYLEIKNSETFTIYGNTTMSKPGPKSSIEERKFLVLEDDKIKARSTEVNFLSYEHNSIYNCQVNRVKTLSGISRMFCYIVLPDGEVMFRKFPCFCVICSAKRFKFCQYTSLSGVPVVVVKKGQNIRVE